ncbi:MAG: ATP--guanido phosphotransferase [Planctomycetes bacterium]|nr:ATP--guanido phosphotransferase [Planctomycetota bacterium]
MLEPEAYNGPDAWTRGNGPEADVVLSTRVRLARNVADFHFPSRLDDETRARLQTRIVTAINDSKLADDVRHEELQDADALHRQLLWERNLISREAMQGKGVRGVSWSAQKQFSIMTNEEDHLRIQTLRAGFAPAEALACALEVDTQLDTRIEYAWSAKLGYLTACPTNVGTGLRISVMLHVPALVQTRQMDKVNKATAEVGLTVRGQHGEGSKALGDVIQISNQRTLGSTEPELLEVVLAMLLKIVEYERVMREKLLADSKTAVEDRIWRSVGTLRHARRLPHEETLGLLSAVRLGITMKLLPTMGLDDMNEMLVLSQPAHLQALFGKAMDAGDRDIARATWMRDRFKPESN